MTNLRLSRTKIGRAKTAPPIRNATSRRPRIPRVRGRRSRPKAPRSSNPDRRNPKQAKGRRVTRETISRREQLSASRRKASSAKRRKIAFCSIATHREESNPWRRTGDSIACSGHRWEEPGLCLVNSKGKGGMKSVDTFAAGKRNPGERERRPLGGFPLIAAVTIFFAWSLFCSHGWDVLLSPGCGPAWAAPKDGITVQGAR